MANSFKSVRSALQLAAIVLVLAAGTLVIRATHSGPGVSGPLASASVRPLDPETTNAVVRLQGQR